MISIIIPTLNEEKYIGRLLDSLINQDTKGFEIIIVDGSSNNKTADAVKGYSKLLKCNKIKLKTIKTGEMKIKEHRIPGAEIKEHKTNVSCQRNIGAEKAAYDNLVFIDADSVLEKDVIRKISAELENGSTDSGGCYTYPLADDALYRLYYLIFRVFTRIVYKADGINGCLIFTKKKVHDMIKGFNEEIILAEDYEYTKRLIRNSRFKLMKGLKVRTAIRRFNHDGKVMLPLKLMCAGLYRLFIGDIKNDLFRYKFGIFNK